MPKTFGDPSDKNLLLASLSLEMRQVMGEHLEAVHLEQRTALEYPGEETGRVVFPISCVGSVVAISQSDRRIEVGLFGFDGMSGTSIVTGVDTSPLETFVQIAGNALSIETAPFRDLLDTHAELRAHFVRYVQCLSIQTAQTALSNGHARLEERLSRWLLMSHDRIVGDRMNLTHEFLSVMLGVRRAGVTVGLHLLEGKGLIRGERGVVTVLDRDGLESEAQGSYGIPEREYLRVFPSAGAQG